MQQSDRIGLLYALAGFCLLSISDNVVKSMADEWTPTALASVRYVVGAVALSALLFARQGAAPFRAIPKPGVQLLRGMGLGISTVAFFASVWVMPLSDAVAITFVQPMITAILAVLFLGERLQLNKVLAIVVAFAGVLIVLRPNFAEIGFAALLPLVVATGMAVLMIGNRAARGAGSVLAAQAYGAIIAAAILVGVAFAGDRTGMPEIAFFWPEWHVLARTALVALFASTAHWLIFKGTERAGAATVAPMTYVQILVATTLAWIFFDEVPDLVALGGAALIIAAGLWLWQMGRKADAAAVAKAGTSA